MVETYQIQLIKVDECQRRINDNSWNSFAKDKIILVLSNAYVLCYFDAVPCFTYFNPDSEQQPVPISSNLESQFKELFITALLETKNYSFATVITFELIIRRNNDDRLISYSNHTQNINKYLLELIKNNLARNIKPVLDNSYLKGLTFSKNIIEASAIYVLRNESVLMAEKPSQKALKPGVYYLPGGRLEGNESPLLCAQRELSEETGLLGGVYKLLGISLYPDPRNAEIVYRFYQFIAKGIEGQAYPNDDIIACKWIKISKLNKEELFELTWAGIFIGRLLNLF